MAKNEFLGSKEISVADITIAVQLRYIFCLVLDEAARSGLPHLTKWFVHLTDHAIFKEYFGKTWLCQKEYVPDFGFAPKKKEEPKKEEPKKEQPKKEQKKKEKEEDEKEDVHPFLAGE